MTFFTDSGYFVVTYGFQDKDQLVAHKNISFSSLISYFIITSFPLSCNGTYYSFLLFLP